MRVSYFAPLALCSISFVFAALSPRDVYRVKETIAPPSGWVKYAAPPATHIIELRIGLPQPNFNVLEQHLYEVSDPSHKRYGQHLSKEDVEDLVAPHPESSDAVNKWLNSFGIVDLVYSPAKDWITIKVPIALAEKLLDTVCAISVT